MPQHNRPLTYDEKKAAEAAFTGLPFDLEWSEAARKVYLGLSTAIENKCNEGFQEISPSQRLPDKEIPLQYVFLPTKQPIQEEGVGYPFLFGNSLQL